MRHNLWTCLRRVGLVYVLIAQAIAVYGAPPASFVLENVVEGLDQPISLRFLPDGRMLLLQKKGTILIVNTASRPASYQVYLNLAASSHVDGINADQERGLLDVAIDPAFPAQPYIYLFYTPKKGPNGAKARVARFRHLENGGGLASRGDPASETIIWQDTDGYDSCCHFGGGLDFGPDGNLWLATGDHFQGSYALDLAHAGGKIHRFAKDGSIPATNPFRDGNGPNVDSVVAFGLRNPFRARWDLPSNRFYIAEVGGNEQPIAWEDLHVIDYDPATGEIVDNDYGTAGDNFRFDGIFFGWPTVEGLPPFTDFPGYSIDSPVGEPIFAYRHSGNTSAINGGVVYRGNQFPAQYQGAYFYADSTRDFIRYLKFDAKGGIAPNPSPGAISIKNPDAISYGFDLAPVGRITCLDTGPDGALYYVSFTDSGGAYGQSNPSVLGAVRRYVYEGGNNRPVISSFQATPKSGVSPLVTEFTLKASDFEKHPMQYLIRFGDGTSTSLASLSDGVSRKVTHTYSRDGLYTATLEVSDPTSTAASTTEVEVGTRPIIGSLTVSNSRPGSTNNVFRYGDTLTFSANATDAEDGSVAASGYSWSVLFIRPGNAHPSMGPVTGVKSISFPIPNQGQGFSGNVLYRCYLTVTDSSGLSATSTIEVYPQKANIDLRSEPTGMLIQVDGNTAKAAPYVLDTLVNFNHTITAPQTACVNGTNYEFAGWSNNVSAPQQVFNVPTTDTLLVAKYVANGLCSSIPSDALALHLSADSGVVKNGSAVSTWEDQSRNLNHLVAAGAPQLQALAPNGKPSIRFNGVADALYSLSAAGLPTGNANRTIVMLVRYNATNTGGGWAGFAYGAPKTNAAFGATLTAAGTLGVQGWGAANDVASNPAENGIGSWLTHTVVLKNGVVSQFRDGKPIGTATRTYATASGTVRVGEELDGAKNLNMDVAEIMVFNRALEAGELSSVNSYLLARYGSLANKAPSVSITSPASGSGFSLGQSISFSAAANDPEDGSLTSKIVWSSQLSGMLGTGSPITLSTLPLGTHVVTASVTDSKGASASSSVSFTIALDPASGLPLNGLVLQLESDRNIAAGPGNTVAGWLDQSGLGNDLVAMGNPVLVARGTPSGLPAIHFDGDGDKLERSHQTSPLGGLPTGNANRTMYAVIKYNSSPVWAGVAYGTGSSNKAFGLTAKPATQELSLQGWGGSNDLTGTVKASGWQVQEGLLESGVGKLFRNGTLVSQFTHTYATTLTRLVIGEEIARLGYADMEIAAVLIYNRALTAAERAKVSAYLTTKYITSNASPVVVISNPATGSTFLRGAAVAFSGTAQDIEDGNLSSTLQWTSSVDGLLGTGASLSVSSLSPGLHTISASARDSMNASSSSSIQITITNPISVPVTSGLVFQLESDQSLFTDSNGQVTVWRDLSGRGNDLVSEGNPVRVALGTPTGQASVRFDGVDDSLARIHALEPIKDLPLGNANRTVFLVAKYNSGSAWAGFSYGSGASNAAFGLVAKQPGGELVLQGWGTGNDLVSTTVGNGGGWLVQSGMLSSSVGTLYRNGTEIAKFAHSYKTSVGSIVLGEEIRGLGNVSMEIAAVLVYNRALTAAERSSVNAYLLGKYIVR
ncbi:PQQ-dependent sugar dehydrogenase [Pelagicoccus sp. SDUM812003]|uniref:PQQ-dependent sugar dehydrogenase n=1 Tax=Pelagicoccus sp. SDUM812003 TaxID=3041267 RepID=UPI00280F367C|nr:PQQ-dependent sugar dehydrogenase [Pelagicoccus sp. SDUM812003]MDQ8205563.1 PQQ-dependent sugar dehydrogenase [Pelagicoccus sp. SDUM812003]